MLSIERQLGSNTVFSISYVGSQGHRLLVMAEANPGNPAALPSLPGSLGPFGESGVYTTASGQVINGTRGPLGSNFGSDTLQKTIGKSNYNSLQLSLRHTSGRLELSAGYTYGKSLDESSNLGEEVNPINPALSYALSSFDIRQNFVVSYNYRIPFENLFRASNRWTQGWEISGLRTSPPACPSPSITTRTAPCSAPFPTASITTALTPRSCSRATLESIETRGAASRPLTLHGSFPPPI